MKLYLLRLFRLRSSTHKIALGISIGFLPNWVPSFGLGPFLSVLLAKLFRANASAALIGGVSGTFMWPFLFYLNYRVGAWALREKSEVSDLEDVPYQHLDTPNDVGNLNSLGVQFVTGMVINGLVFAILFYILFFVVFKKYRLPLLAIVRKM
ncbi:DUF2062 domain-containing protein [Ammoniphilus oxalaticus]|uniref:DUF2062 domain-containing protein n=1 Tax=Ammoniphilus oxalaticus TaxID=66863 RepID=UPI002482636D|nr:DUF2062 domain-containing protein [Ammoniphilus oxalaticus]